MLVPFLIMLREGVEASLIVGIVASYLTQTGRPSWLFAVWAGVALAVLLCAAIGLILSIVNADFPQKQQELFEAVIGVVAVFMLTSMVFWMKQAARSMKAGLQGFDRCRARPWRQPWACFGWPGVFRRRPRRP